MRGGRMPDNSYAEETKWLHQYIRIYGTVYIDFEVDAQLVALDLDYTDLVNALSAAQVIGICDGQQEENWIVLGETTEYRLLKVSVLVDDDQLRIDLVSEIKN
jgi:hypothetical protein